MTTQISEDVMRKIAADARGNILRLGHEAGSFGAHYGPALSMVEILTAIYGTARTLSPASCGTSERDRVILSKGHGSLALYTVLHGYGFIGFDILKTAEQDGSRLPGQPIRDQDLGIEFSSGSLGMGLSFGLGLALSARLSRSDRHVYVVMGDGETNEGSVWEAAMAASHFGLKNLTAIVDVNDLQSDGSTDAIMSFDHSAAWRGFGWDVADLDGHSLPALCDALQRSTDRPRCLLARTTKGKGISFMEDVAEWHHGRLSEDQYTLAMNELDAGVGAS